MSIIALHSPLNISETITDRGLVGDDENAGVEKSGVDSRGGICRSDNGWKAVRKEKKSRAYKVPTT